MRTPLPDHHLSARIRDLIRAADIGILTTPYSRLAISSGSGRKAEWDETGSICFGDRVHTETKMLRKKVKLFYCNPATADYVSIYGEAEVEAEAKLGVWDSFLRLFSSSTNTASDLKLHRVTPTEAYLWDTENSRMISVYGMKKEEPLAPLVSNRLCGEVIL